MDWASGPFESTDIILSGAAHAITDLDERPDVENSTHMN